MSRVLSAVSFTFFSVLGDDSEGGGFVHRAMAQTGTVRRHHGAVSGVHIELHGSSCGGNQALILFHFSLFTSLFGFTETKRLSNITHQLSTHDTVCEFIHI